MFSAVGMFEILGCNNSRAIRNDPDDPDEVDSLTNDQYRNIIFTKLEVATANDIPWCCNLESKQ
jgi:hypothetical protein